MTNLTQDESKWLKRLQKVLSQCPSNRIGFYTIGDPYLELYDKSSGVDTDLREKDFCRLVDDYDAHLGRLRFPSAVHSTVG